MYNKNWKITLLIIAILVAILASLVFFQLIPVNTTDFSKKKYRFVMIPIIEQGWFDIVHNASVEAAKKLENELNIEITIDYQVPEKFSIIAQNNLFEKMIATNPDGIAIDLIDPESQLLLVKEAQRRGIPVVLYAAKPPKGELIPHIGNDFYEQGLVAGEALLKRINYKGKIAIIQGVPTNSPHVARYKAYVDLVKKYPEVEIVATAFDYDAIDNAHKEAVKILQQHPDLAGFAVCTAAGPIGAGRAINEAGKAGEIKLVGIDDLPQLQELMREGILDLSVSTRPRSIGTWITVTLLMSNIGIKPVIWYDTKYGLLTPDMAKDKSFQGF